MCGIVCALNINQDSSKLRNQVLEMSKKLRHRGPDWNGIYCDENVILAHERLAIVDPKSGKQPLFSNDKRYVLAANGEIYNTRDLTAAHKTLPMPSFVRVTNLENGKSLILRINDRGPYIQGRMLDCSYGAAKKLGFSVNNEWKMAKGAHLYMSIK